MHVPKETMWELGAKRQIDRLLEYVGKLPRDESKLWSVPLLLRAAKEKLVMWGHTTHWDSPASKECGEYGITGCDPCSDEARWFDIMGVLINVSGGYFWQTKEAAKFIDEAIRKKWNGKLTLFDMGNGSLSHKVEKTDGTGEYGEKGSENTWSYVSVFDRNHLIEYFDKAIEAAEARDNDPWNRW